VFDSFSQKFEGNVDYEGLSEGKECSKEMMGEAVMSWMGGVAIRTWSET
jgi:hypothetical protein